MRVLLLVAAIGAISTCHALPAAQIHTMRLRGAGDTPKMSLNAVSQITGAFAAAQGVGGWLWPEETAKMHGLPRDLTPMERMSHIGSAAHSLAIAALVYFTARGEPIHVGVGWANAVMAFYWFFAAFHKKSGAQALGLPIEPMLMCAGFEALLAILALNEGCGEMDIDNVVLASGLWKFALSAAAMLAPKWFLTKFGVKDGALSPFSNFMLHQISIMGFCQSAFVLLYDDLPAHAVTLGLSIGVAGNLYNIITQRHKVIGTPNGAPFYAFTLLFAPLSYFAYQLTKK